MSILFLCTMLSYFRGVATEGWVGPPPQKWPVANQWTFGIPSAPIHLVGRGASLPCICNIHRVKFIPAVYNFRRNCSDSITVCKAIERNINCDNGGKTEDDPKPVITLRTIHLNDGVYGLHVLCDKNTRKSFEVNNNDAMNPDKCVSIPNIKHSTKPHLVR